MKNFKETYVYKTILISTIVDYCLRLFSVCCL